MIRRRVRVTGRVQGVGFRDAARRRAELLGVAGWVRNEPDGSVVAVVEGDADAVERFVEWAREGPRGAWVEDVEVRAEEPEGLSGFVVR